MPVMGFPGETRFLQHPGCWDRAGGVGGLPNSQRKHLVLEVLETGVKSTQFKGAWDSPAGVARV